MSWAQALLHLNITDYLILSIIVISTLISLMRGFVKEAISLIIWVAGFWVAMKFYASCAHLLVKYIDNASIRLIVSFLLLLIAVLVLGTLLNYILSFIIKKSGLSGLDRLLGLVFGCLRGVLLVAVGLLLLSSTSFVKDSWWENSILIPHLYILMDWLRALLPQKITTLAAIIKH